MAKRITVGGALCEIPWVHFNGSNAISVSMKFPGSSHPTPVDFFYGDCIRCASMPSDTSLAFGICDKPRGFGADDVYDLHDDHWVVMDFSAQKFANVQVGTEGLRGRWRRGGVCMPARASLTDHGFYCYFCFFVLIVPRVSSTSPSFVYSPLVRSFVPVRVCSSLDPVDGRLCSALLASTTCWLQ